MAGSERRVCETINFSKALREKWLGFLHRMEYPKCLGVLYGKHIAIEFPGYSISEYYNYKWFFSILLVAMCDAKYCSILVNVGNYGKETDAQVFNNSDIGRDFRANELLINSRSIISGHYLPYLIVSDEICAHRSG